MENWTVDGSEQLRGRCTATRTAHDAMCRTESDAALPCAAQARYGHPAYASSNARSSFLFVPRMRSTTAFAQSKYSRRRARGQSCGALAATSRTLQILSASFKIGRAHV